jgi:hypothetical protein
MQANSGELFFRLPIWCLLNPLTLGWLKKNPIAQPDDFSPAEGEQKGKKRENPTDGPTINGRSAVNSIPA